MQIVGSRLVIGGGGGLTTSPTRELAPALGIAITGAILAAREQSVRSRGGDHAEAFLDGCRIGPYVVIQVWGAHERCDLEAMKRLARPFLPPLRELAAGAGLTPEAEFDSTWTLEYPDANTLGQALVAVAGLAVLAGPEREDDLRTAIVDGLSPYRVADGSYRLSNEFHYLIARAQR